MTLVRVLDLLGIGVFAVSGALAAGRKRLDLLGVFVLASVTAIGGGTIRDLLLARHPLVWLTDATYLGVIVVAVAVTFAYVRWRRPPLASLLVADALGLVLRRGNLYASTVIVGIAAYLALESVGVPRQTASLTGMALIAAVRFAAIRWELALPVFEVNE